jgi:CBS domain-containing protein
VSVDLHPEALEKMIELEVREIPILDDAGHVVGLLDELEVSRTYLEGSSRAEQAAMRESGLEDEDVDE